jgi:tetratricopeptide (TPR) repeat protein
MRPASLLPGYSAHRGALPALAQPDRYDEQDEAVKPEALAQFRKGERLAKNENFAEAVAAFRQAVTLQPDYAQAYHQMGLAYAGLNRYPEAVKAARRPRLQPGGPDL